MTTTHTVLQEGMSAPEFTLPSSEGKPVTLSQWRGTAVVLYFYPQDDTPGCTREACDFRDQWSALQARGAILLGVSADSPASHRQFQQKYQLPFVLLSDADGAVAHQYGVWNEAGYARRATFVIGPDGRLRRIFPKVQVDGHAAAVLDALAPAA